jgi:hypothetical protein
MTDENHDGHTIVRDSFLQLPGVSRATPGDCYCKTCKKPVALVWNKGRPVPWQLPKGKK